MPLLRNVVESFQRRPELLTQVLLPKESKSEKFVKMLESKFPPIPVSYVQEELDVLVSRYREMHKENDWESAKLGDLKKLTWAFSVEEVSFIEDELFLKRYLMEVSTLRSFALFLSVIKGYLRCFEVQKKGVDILGGFIRKELKSDWVSSWKKKGFWLDMDKNFNLFDNKKAIDTVLSIWKKEKKLSFLIGLSAYKVFTPHGFVKCCLERILLDFPSLIKSYEPIEREEFCYDLIRELESLPKDFLCIEQLEATALLMPWIKDSPTDEFREYIMDRLIRSLKDPRIYDSGWLHVNETAKQVFLRWLNKQALEMFLQVVDHTTSVDQWDARRDFWSGYEEAGYVEEAWVAFGPDGAKYAKTRYGKDIQFAILGSGDGSFQDDHAVLILRIGSVLVADWNHNGACHIWSHDIDAPKLYQNRYLVRELRDNHDERRVHLGDWMSKVANYIYRETGIRHPRAKRGYYR